MTTTTHTAKRVFGLSLLIKAHKPLNRGYPLASKFHAFYTKKKLTKDEQPDSTYKIYQSLGELGDQSVTLTVG